MGYPQFFQYLGLCYSLILGCARIVPFRFAKLVGCWLRERRLCGVLEFSCHMALGLLLVLAVGGLGLAIGPDTVTLRNVTEDLQYLSSDELSGRGVGTEGIDQAAQFIANRFRELGLKVDTFGGSPFQEFNIRGATKIGTRERNFLTIENATDPQSNRVLELASDFNPLELGSNGAFRGELVFAGYGITAPEFGYDDLAGVDVSGKVLIVIRKEPQQNDPSSKFAGTRNTDYAPFSSKVLNAAVHKAAALIIVNDSVTLENATAQLKKDFDSATAQLESLQRNPPPADASEVDKAKWSSQLTSLSRAIETLRAKQSKDPDAILDVGAAGKPLSAKHVPTFFCSRAAINPLLQKSLGKDLSQLEREIDQDLKPRTVELEGLSARGEVLLEGSETPVRNVVGWLPGAGELADQFVVVGAHYDHVGMGGAGSLAPGTIAVHNGADDNGSGTVALLEMARLCATELQTPRRTLIFIAFTAEESGLLGSKHYVRNPRWPLEKTVAMINLDMVGRLSNNELTVYGVGTSPNFSSMVDRLNEPFQYRLVKELMGRGPSDHSSFYDAKIPVLHFFTGLHNDYHRPSDDFDKVNLPELSRVVRLVTNVTQELAYQPNPPVFQSTSGSARPRRQSSAAGVLGVRLSAEIDRVIVVGLAPGGAAERAGILKDDQIVEIDGVKLQNPAALQEFVTNRKPGDEVKILIERQGQRLEIHAKLGG